MKGLKVLFFSGTGKTLMARQIGKMLNTREPKIISGPGTEFNQNISLRIRGKRFCCTSSLRTLERVESETFGQYRFRRKRLLQKLSKDNNVSIYVMY